MGHLDEEERRYLDDVEAVKQWWQDSRWRYTRRPYTAEQIVQKRGNLKIEYPSHVQAQKLWRIVEGRFAVCSLSPPHRSALALNADSNFIRIKMPPSLTVV